MGLGDQSHVDRFFKHFTWETVQRHDCWAADLENNCHQDLYICQRNFSPLTPLCPYIFFFLNFSKTLEFYDLKLLLRCIILVGVLFHTSVLAKNLLHTFKMKNIIIILCVVIKMKPSALFPLFPLIYGKTHPPLQHSCVPTKDGTNLKTAWNWSRNWVWQHCRQPCTDKFC